VPISNGLRDTGQQTASTDKWKENHPCQQTPGIVGAMLTELRYARWFLPLSVPLGLGPKKSEVRVADGTLHVKMGWGFEAHIPVASITRAEATEERAFTAGVHYSSGRWLVNGSSKGLVTFDDRAAGKGESRIQVGDAALVGGQRDRSRSPDRRVHRRDRLAGR
jgi:hypothetical protein